MENKFKFCWKFNPLTKNVDLTTILLFKYLNLVFCDLKQN